MSRQLNKITLDEIEVLMQYCSGGDEKLLRTLIDQYREFTDTKPRKYGNFSLGEIESIFNKVGGKENLQSLLQGRAHVALQSGKPKMFDRHGRLIPEVFALNSPYVDPDRSQSAVSCRMESVEDLKSRILHFQTCYEGLRTFDLRWDALKLELEHLIDLVGTDQQISNLLKGPWFPVLLPMEKKPQFGLLVEKYLDALGESYRKSVQGKPSVLLGCDATKSVSQIAYLAPECEHYREILNRISHDHVLVLHFPMAMQGWSISAMREAAEALKEKRLYPSGIDALAAMATYPNNMLSHSSSPRYFVPSVGINKGSQIEVSTLELSSFQYGAGLSANFFLEGSRNIPANSTGGLCFTG